MDLEDPCEVLRFEPKELPVLDMERNKLTWHRVLSSSFFVSARDLLGEGRGERE